jgi:hypothetical protein
MTVQQLGDGHADGVQTPNTKLGFFGITPVAKRAETAGQTALSTSAALAVTTISSGAFGYTSAQANGILAAINEIQAVLRLYGLIP